MSIQSYSSLLSGMWAPEGSDLNQRLNKLQELERIRKERDAKRQMNRTQRTSARGIRSRMRSDPAESENDPTDHSSFLSNFDSDLQSTFNEGTGARPKFTSSNDKPDPNNDWNNMFQSITGEILNLPVYNQPDSFSRDRFGRSDPEEESSGFRSRYGSSFRSYNKPNYTSRYNRSNSQPEEQQIDDYFSEVTRSVLSDTDSGPNYSLQSHEPQSYTRRRYERNHEVETNQEEGEQQTENSEQQTEEVIEIIDDEDDSEEPIHFIERLKKGHETDENNDEFNLNQKRNVSNGILTPSLTVPPMKKLKPGETDTDNDDEQYEDVARYIHPVEDIIAVAKDINAAFGVKSPKSPKSFESPKQNDNESAKNLSFHHDSTAENTNGDFVFTASTPDLSAGKQKTSGIKRKQRSSTKGAGGAFNSPTKTMAEETHEISNDGKIDETDSSVVYEHTELPEDSFAAEQEELASATSDLYKSRFSTNMDLNQTNGQLDQMQEFFSGQAVKGDPLIWHVLNGISVEHEWQKKFDDSTPKGKKDETGKGKQSDMSLGDRLTKLKSMTDAKSKKSSSIGYENRQNAASSGQNKSPYKDVSRKIQTEGTRRSESPKAAPTKPPNNVRKEPVTDKTIGDVRKESETKKSPRDLVNDVRELKKFIHESVSEPSTPILETQISLEKRFMKEISTQTDLGEVEYICKHCGKSSSEKVEPGKKPFSSSKSTKLDLKLETKNPSQNYAALEKNHLAEIKKEMKISNKALPEADNKKPEVPGSKPKIAVSTPSYMKSTTSSKKKTNGNLEKTRKGSAPDINKIKEIEAQRSKSPVGFSKGGKNIVAQRAKAFDNTNVKNNAKQMTKPGLSLYRGASVDREQNNEVASSKVEKITSNITKSKSLEQMHVIPDDKTSCNKADSSKKLVKQKSVGDELEKSVENKQTEQSADSNVLPSAGIKRTRAQMTQKSVSPALSPKPVKKIESPGLISPITVSPLRAKENTKPPSGIHSGFEGNKAEVLEDQSSKRVERDGQFTTLQDNPFIKNDSKRRNSLRGRNEGESVWERERSRSRDSSLRRSNTSAGERSSLTHLSWSDCGSTESLPASMSSSRGSSSNFQRSKSERRDSVTSITSQNSMLNLLDPKGTKTDVVTGMKETNVDEAYEEYIALKDNPDAEQNEEDKKNDSGLIDFAQKACSLLEFEPKKRDSSSDSTENAGNVKDDTVDKSKSNVVANGTSNLTNGVSKSAAVSDKTGKKTKQKKGFFKGKLFNK